ncbi:MAG: hypothetical protein PHD03_01565 [Bacilli bacterium]|nr:hypothetical protein [Bacilli bacterium]MDD4406840.1 hypothetical protein [Bacilli bacterium]
MKKKLNLLFIFILFFIFMLNVKAIDYNTPVYSDMTYNQCVDFQDSALYTTGSGYFGHCIKATCYSGVWKTYYYISENMVRCANGNDSQYVQIVKTGCSNYVGSCAPSTKERYCSMITYYDCNKTTSGALFTTTTTAPPFVPPVNNTTKKTTPNRPIPPKTTSRTTMPIIKSNNNFIESLVIKDIELIFDKNINNYTIQLAEDIKTLNFTIVLEDTKANYKIENNEEINRELPIKITVTAEDESVRVYTINIKEKEEVLDSNSKLDVLKIEGFKIKFDPDILTYDLTIKKQSILNISVIPQSETASYYITGNSNLKNKSQITINVKAEDTSETKYIINIKKSNNFTNIIIIILVMGIAGFVGFKVFRKVTTKEVETSYEYE